MVLISLLITHTKSVDPPSRVLFERFAGSRGFRGLGFGRVWEGFPEFQSLGLHWLRRSGLRP